MLPAKTELAKVERRLEVIFSSDRNCYEWESNLFWVPFKQNSDRSRSRFLVALQK
jgi:hypothetical protein